MGLKSLPSGAAEWQVSNFNQFTQPGKDGPKLDLRLEGTR
jgi:hypothetical protein